MATEVAQLPHLNIVNRVLELPIIELALHKSVETYTKVKDSYQLVHWAFTTAETSLSTATKQAIPIAVPIAKRLESPINFVDHTLCLGLDKIEEKVPLMKKNPAQILMKAKSRISYVNDLIVTQASNLGSASWVKANQILDTQYGNAAVKGLDNTAFVVDKLIDKYFPPTEEEQETKKDQEKTKTETNIAEEDKLLHTLQTIGHLSNKASRRVYSNVIRYLSTVKKEVLLKDYVRRLVEFLHLTSYLQCENTIAKESKQVQTNGEIKGNKRKSESEDKRETEPEENIEKEKHE